MITDPQERSIVSSLGWMDGSSIWCLDVASGRHRNVAIGDAHLQSAAGGTAQFIGQLAFDADEAVRAVARPFSSDVVGLDPRTLRIESTADPAAQPLEVAGLRDRRVYARDWKSGALLRGDLSR